MRPVHISYERTGTGNRIVGGVVSGIQAIETKGHAHFCLNYVR